MASKRRKRRVQCGSKRKYDKQGAAEQSAIMRRLYPTHVIDAYPCKFCGSWHIGHRPAHINRLIKERRENTHG